MPPFDIDIYSLFPIMKYECDRQYCLYEEQKIMSRLGQSFRRVSHSTKKYYPIDKITIGQYPDDLFDG